MLKTKTMPLLATSLLLFATVVAAGEPELPSFTAETIDDEVKIGYGTAVGDVNGDGKPDILLVDKTQIRWYENPSWRKHVIAENLTVKDNVCIAARDIDGDGKVEIAVGAQWNPGDTVGSGAVFYLIPPEDRTQQWAPVELHHEPVVHRMRWVRAAEDDFVLVVAPLHGRGNRNGQGAGVRLLAYHMPEDPRQPWKTTLLEDTLHVTHNFDPCQWLPGTAAEEILYAGRQGAMLIAYADGKWSRRKFPRIEGAGEIRNGRLTGGEQYIVTIEPLHGDRLVLYRSDYRQGSETSPVSITGRVVLDDSFKQGHAIATADLFGDAREEIVAGWRNPNRDGKVGVKLYWPAGRSGAKWQSMWIDENGMATEDVRLGDVDGDGRIDIVAAGRATGNLKVYWNRPAK